MKKPPKNLAASVKQRLLNLAKKRGEDFNFLLGRYAVERLLYRLGQTPDGKRFVLKGAMLFHFRADRVPHRSTHDLDLLGRGEATLARMEQLFQKTCGRDVANDGMRFDETTVKAEFIKTGDEYHGVRVHLTSYLDSARIPLQIDIGFGDAVTPEPQRETLATLLEFPAPEFLVYPWEVVVAEKFNAIVVLGMDNSRMKDYFDLYHLARTQDFDGPTLMEALQATFERRATVLPTVAPIGLTSEFATDQVKVTQWQAFIRRLGSNAGHPSLDQVIKMLVAFLMPVTTAGVGKQAFKAQWHSGGLWK